MPHFVWKYLSSRNPHSSNLSCGSVASLRETAILCNFAAMFTALRLRAFLWNASCRTTILCPCWDWSRMLRLCWSTSHHCREALTTACIYGIPIVNVGYCRHHRLIERCACRGQPLLRSKSTALLYGIDIESHNRNSFFSQMPRFDPSTTQRLPYYNFRHVN